MVKEEKYLSFVRTMCSSNSVAIVKRRLSEYVKTLDLSASPDNLDESVTTKLLESVGAGLEVFVAPNTRFSVNSLAVLSKCHKLVRLDLPSVYAFVRVQDLLRAVSTLPCLETFQFSRRPPAYPHPDDSDNGQNENKSTWPDSLENFHIPSSPSSLYLPAFEKAPASLNTLIVDNAYEVSLDVLDSVFRLISSRILTLRARYELEDNRDHQLARILLNCPNLHHIDIRPCFVFGHERGHIDLKADHPLRFITVNLDALDDTYGLEDTYGMEDTPEPGTKFFWSLQDLLYDEQLADVERVLLYSGLSPHRGLRLLRHLNSLEADGIGIIFDIDRLLLLEQGSDESDFTETGVWLVDSEDSDANICKLTEENVDKIRREEPIIWDKYDVAIGEYCW